MIVEDEKRADDAAIARLDALGQSLASKRKEAMEYREQCGLASIWEQDQDAYDGIDDANRSSDRYAKPQTATGRPMAEQRDATATTSTVFVNITQPYVDMAAARVADMLLPTDDMPFGIEPTPIPDFSFDMVARYADGAEVVMAQMAQEVESARRRATDAAKRAEKRIWDWLVQSQWHAEVRKVIEDAARIGTGVLKGPFPYRKKIKRVTQDGIAIEYIVEPASKRIDVRNLFPAKGCGESIHNGEYIWERDYISKKKLSDLKGGDYLDSQIDLCLKEGPGGATDPKEENEEREKMYEIWYFHGLVEKEDMEAAGCECDDDVYAIITTVNDRVIMAAQSPLDSGEFPYDVLPWQRRGGSWTGIGVARQIRTPQRMVNAATRRLLDNGGLSSAPLSFMAKNGVEPVDNGRMGITPGRQYWVDLGELRSVRDAVFFQEIPSRQAELLGTIQYALTLAERLTSMPLMMQGQQGDATKTVGGMQILQNNSSSVLRRIASLADDNVFEPHVTRYYEWLMIYGEDIEKGDSQVVAKGSSALFERDAQGQAIKDLAAIVKDPAFGISPARWIVEWFKAQRLDPARFQLTDEEKQKAATAAPPQDPRIAAADIRARADIQKAEMNLGATQGKVQAAMAESERQREHEINKALLERQTEMMRLAAKSDMTLDQIKAKLAADFGKIGLQRELAGRTQVISPPTEPPGRARDGHAYEE